MEQRRWNVPAAVSEVRVGSKMIGIETHCSGLKLMERRGSVIQPFCISEGIVELGGRDEEVGRREGRSRWVFGLLVGLVGSHCREFQRYGLELSTREGQKA